MIAATMSFDVEPGASWPGPCAVSFAASSNSFVRLITYKFNAVSESRSQGYHTKTTHLFQSRIYFLVFSIAGVTQEKFFNLYDDYAYVQYD